MPLPSNADQVVVQGFLFDEETGGGLQAAVTSEPVALTGQSAAPMVLDAVSHAHIQTRPRTTTPDPVTGYWALLALATNDPDLEAYGGRRITLPGQVARTIEVPWDAPQVTVSAGMAAQINPGNVDGRPKAGDTVRVLWFHSAAGYVAPTPASAYYDAAATRSLIADSIAAAGGGSGTADLPEVDRTTVASDPTTLLGKTTRYSTTSAAINQTLPDAQPGRQLAVGWDAGTNALTLTAAGTDVVGAGSATTVPFAVLGHLVTLHCTVAGRWRVTSGFTPQAAQDARYMLRPDETGAAAGSLSALRKGSGGGYTLEVVDETAVTATDLGAVPVSLVDAKGDLLVGTADNLLARKPVGGDGQVLVADATAAGGVKWATPTGGGSGISPSLVDAKGDLLVGSADDTVIRKAIGTDGQVLTADSAATGGLKWATPAAGGGGGSNPFPLYAAGMYFIPIGWQNATSASNALGIGNLRVMPWVLPRQQVIDRIGIHVISAGETGAKMRLGIWADSGGGLPGALVVDAGQVAADVAANPEAVLATPLVLPAGIYWVGGVVQNVTTTQPTVRNVANPGANLPFPLPQPSVPGTGDSFYAVLQNGVTGAFPASFSTTPTLSTNSSPRTFMRAAS